MSSTTDPPRRVDASHDHVAGAVLEHERDRRFENELFLSRGEDTVRAQFDLERTADRRTLQVAVGDAFGATTPIFVAQARSPTQH